MNKQSSLFDIDDNQRVECLGKIFDSEDQRREYFRNELRKKLPGLRKIEGFPKGNDEDIIALSDPPYYTACPNPWISDFTDEWSRNSHNNDYYREPFTSDVSDSRADRIYKVHSYVTKVPHKAIMRYLLHYTSPGDTILDGFSGTGMTGVATAFLNDKKEIESLGYYINNENEVFDENGNLISRVGSRNVILNDLSPAATLIANSYNKFLDLNDFKKVAADVLDEVKLKTNWLFVTNGKSDNKKYKVDYSVWSDVFLCPNCQKEFVYWDVAVDVEKKKVKKIIYCPNCNIELSKKNVDRAFETIFDSSFGKNIRVAKRKQVMISYTAGKKRINKQPDEYDNELQQRINDYKINTFFPKNKIINGDEISRVEREGITNVSQLYSKRNLIVMSIFYDEAKKTSYFPELLNILRSSTSYSNKMVKVNIPRLLGKGGVYAMGAISGTYYLPSINGERSMIEALENKIKSVEKNALRIHNNYIISTQDTGSLSNIPNNTVDYIFIDPPFGENLMYSELNYLAESWMRVFTNNKKEAIINHTQGKGLFDYQRLMTKDFSEMFRVLKPEHWITIEFSNSKSNVWNSIQDSLQKSGFVIANVSALDKKQGSFKAITTPTAVKQDLVITAYKPKEMDINRKNITEKDNNLLWEFVNEHLNMLPIVKKNYGNIEMVPERTPRILFDRMVAFFVQKGLPVPMSSLEFQRELSNRYVLRDGMIFLDYQVNKYDKQKQKSETIVQGTLFISDESSAIEWIRQQLIKKPQTRQDLQPEFMKEIQHIAKYEALPELDELLSENFLQYKGENKVPDQIVSYFHKNYHDLRGLDNTNEAIKEKAMNRWYVPDPNKQVDLDKLRERGLLREFNKYVEEIDGTRKKLKNFRMEAIRAGFKKAWLDKEYQKIVDVVKHLPSKVVEEDDKLLMYYDNASIKVES